MPDPSFHTAQFRDLLPRLRAGDRAARDELVRAAQTRLESMARRMLRRYPVVPRWADGDVFQGAVMRLLWQSPGASTSYLTDGAVPFIDSIRVDSAGVMRIIFNSVGQR